MSIVINILLVIEVLICLLLILLVLMQRPKNEGLGAAFGGGMTENIFGAQTTNVLQTFTRNLGIGFFLISAVLGWLSIRQSTAKSNFQKAVTSAPLPALVTPAPATPVPTAEGLPISVEKTTGLPTTPATPAPESKPDPANPSPSPEPKPTPDAANPAPPADSKAPAPAPAPAPAAGDTKPAEPSPAPTPEAPKPAEPAKE